MFAIPLIGLRASGAKIPVWLKIAALSGFVMTLLYVGLSIVPIVQVESRIMFAAKIGGLILTANLIGLGIYMSARRMQTD